MPSSRPGRLLLIRYRDSHGTLQSWCGSAVQENDDVRVVVPDLPVFAAGDKLEAADDGEVVLTEVISRDSSGTVFRLSRSASGRDRRKVKRTPTEMDVFVSSGSGAPVLGLVIDLSVTGALIHVGGGLSTRWGGSLTLSIDGVELVASVRSSRAAGPFTALGVEFVNPTFEQQSQIVRMMGLLRTRAFDW